MKQLYGAWHLWTRPVAMFNWKKRLRCLLGGSPSIMKQKGTFLNRSPIVTQMVSVCLDLIEHTLLWSHVSGGAFIFALRERSLSRLEGGLDVSLLFCCCCCCCSWLSVAFGGPSMRFLKIFLNYSCKLQKQKNP